MAIKKSSLPQSGSFFFLMRIDGIGEEKKNLSEKKSDSEVAIILLRKDWDIAVGGKLIWAFEGCGYVLYAHGVTSFTRSKA